MSMQSLKCNISHCNKKIFVKKTPFGSLCSKHWYGYKKYGTPNIRLITDLNEIIFHKNFAEIILYNVKSVEIAKAKIDVEDIEKVCKLKWNLRKKDNYVFNQKELITIHQKILSKKKGYEIDHINHDCLDNRKINLRYVTKQQNAMNRINVVGVRKSYNRFQAYIVINKKWKHLGMFSSFEEARQVRKEAELKYFKEFSCKCEV